MPWFTRLVNTLRSTRTQRDIDREMAFHLAERVDELRAAGLGAEEAARRARLQFGNPRAQAEWTRDVDVMLWLDRALRDLRYALRLLARTPGFTLTVAATLALGIGANTAVFSAIDAVVLRPLPFPDSHRLMRLTQARATTSEASIAPVRLEDWQRLNTTFAALSGYYTEDASDTSGELPERVKRAFVAPRFLEVWGIAPALGRGFSEAEHRMGGPSAVVISHRYWVRRFNADAAVVGRSVRIGNGSIPVIGVMPASFRFPDRDVDLWFPVAIDLQYAQSRRSTWYTGIGRLQPSATLAEARANLAAVQSQLALAYPDTDADIRVEIVPLKEQTIAGIRASLWVMFGAVTVLLLITCTNIAALLLSRAAHRQQEISLRVSLGASRGAVTSQLLAETALLAVLGGAAGFAVAAAATAAFRSAAIDLPRVDELALDGRVLIYTFATTVIVAVLCGLLPAIRSSRGDLVRHVTDGGRTHASGRHAPQWLLVGAQVALSVTLLVGGGLLVRSWYELSRVDRGFDSSRVLTFRISGNYGETVDQELLQRRIDTALAELASLPGVEAAATTMVLPGVPRDFEATYEVVEAAGDRERQPVAQNRVVSPEYFEVLRISILSGTTCDRTPVGGHRTVVVNRAFATRYLSDWPSPIGLHLKAGDTTSRIVGVAADAREQGLDRSPAPTVYRCFSAPGPTPHFVVRAASDPVALAASVRVKVKELEPLRSVYDLARLDDRIDDAFIQNRLRTMVLMAFALTALSLACVGLYGTLSYAVSRRRREIGLRLALGARREGIVRQFVAQGLRVVTMACLAGLLLALALTQSLSGMLYGVSRFDPLTLALVVAVVLLVATLSAFVPALRAALLDPMRVLREE